MKKEKTGQKQLKLTLSCYNIAKTDMNAKCELQMLVIKEKYLKLFHYKFGIKFGTPDKKYVKRKFKFHMFGF